MSDFFFIAFKQPIIHVTMLMKFTSRAVVVSRCFLAWSLYYVYYTLALSCMYVYRYRYVYEWEKRTL